MVLVQWEMGSMWEMWEMLFYEMGVEFKGKWPSVSPHSPSVSIFNKKLIILEIEKQAHILPFQETISEH